MSTTTPKRGATAKFLALLASLTMMMAGLVGVAMAAPASATPSEKLRICHVNSPNGVGSYKNPYQNIEINDSAINELMNPDSANGHGTHDDPVFDPSKSKFEQDWGDIIPPFKYETEDGLFEFAGLNWFNGDGSDNEFAQAIYANNCNIPDTFLAEDEVRGSVTVCTDNGTVTVNYYGYGDGKSYESQEDADKQAFDEATANALKDRDAQLKELEPYERGECPAPPAAEATLTCSAWSVDLTNYITEDEVIIEEEDLTPRAVAGDPVVVKLDGVIVAEGVIGKDGSYKASGVINPALADGATHTLTVEVDGEVVKTVTSAVCPVPTCEELGNCPVPTCEELGNCPTTTTEEPAPVVAAAVVEAPAPAAVAAPAPANVAVPAAATLPAAVPAGEGSDTGLPMWALAMIAMGMIGAAVAGKQLLGARK